MHLLNVCSRDQRDEFVSLHSALVDIGDCAEKILNLPFGVVEQHHGFLCDIILQDSLCDNLLCLSANYTVEESRRDSGCGLFQFEKEPGSCADEPQLTLRGDVMSVSRTPTSPMFSEVI